MVLISILDESRDLYNMQHVELHVGSRDLSPRGDSRASDTRREAKGHLSMLEADVMLKGVYKGE